MKTAPIRTAFILLFTAISMVSVGSDAVIPWQPYGLLGTIVNGGGQITQVDRAAARAGLRTGDRIDVARMQPADRFSLNRPVQPGRVIALPLASGRVVRLVAHPRHRTTLDNISALCAILGALAYIALAALLVLLRPMPATWAFYGFSFAFCTFAAMPNTWAFPLVIAGSVLLSVAGALSPAAFISFALRFPDARPNRAWEIIEKTLLLGVVPLIALLTIAEFVYYVFDGVRSPAWEHSLPQVLSNGMYACAIAILISRYAVAKDVDRNRLQWVVAAFAVAFLPFLTLGFLWHSNVIDPNPTIINVCQMWEVLAPIALAYTVLKHRLFDIRFVVSRALLYTAMTSLAVGVLALVDWGFGKWLAESRFALAAELALALLLGILMTTVHRRIEYVLNSVIFRAQMLGMAALRRFAQETDLIGDPKRLLVQTQEALRARLECDYAAIYTADGSSFTMAAPYAGEMPALLPGDDLAVLRLRRWNEPFECDEPVHALRNALVVPMIARAQLVGFIVCGPKRDRTHYLPDEIETLMTLAHRTGSAYGWLTLRPEQTSPPPL